MYHILINFYFFKESSKFWDEIKNNMYLFDRKQLLVDFLQSVSLSPAILLLFFDRYIQPSLLRKKFSSQFYGANKKYDRSSINGIDVVLINDPTSFKRSMSLLPIEIVDVRSQLKK
jgi:secreted Zn-dependent insulinase-like peptidase